MREAFNSRHLGRILRAYRHHRFHTPGPLPQEVVAGWMGLTQTQLSRIETGKPVSDLDKLMLWAQTLGMPQRYLWFDLPGESRHGLVCVSPRDPSGLQPLTARSPIDEASLETRRLPSSELDDVLAIVPAPRLSPATIKALEASITDFWKRDDQYGSEALRPAVIAQLRHVLRLLSECRREDQRRSLIGIAAEFARLVGWMFFDACQYRTAQTYFEQSLRVIREIDDRAFIANVLACLSLQATYEAKPADALVLARAAQDACHSVATGRVMAVLSMREAFAHAVLDDKAGCRTAISQSHTSFEKIDTTDPDPLWVAYFDETKLIADTGIALSRLGNHQAAEPLIGTRSNGKIPATRVPLPFIRSGWRARICRRVTSMRRAGKGQEYWSLLRRLTQPESSGTSRSSSAHSRPSNGSRPPKTSTSRPQSSSEITVLRPCNPTARRAAPPTTRY